MDLKVALFSLVPIVLVSLLLFKPKYKNLPPGPRCWPLIGNVAVLFNFNDALTTITNMGRTYGPIMTFWFGNKPTVIASTAEAAMEIMNTNDRVCSGRCIPVGFRLKQHIQYSLVWSNCNEYWKLLRKIARTEIFSPKMLQAQSHVREEKVGELVEYLRSKEGQAVKLTQLLAGTLLNILGNAVFSRDVFVYSDDSDGIGNKFRNLIREMFEIGTQPSIADFFPIFEELDLHGLKRKVNERFLLIKQLWKGIVNERREKRNEETKDMLDVLLAHDFTDAQISALFLDTLGPGSETSSTTIEWVMAILIKNPKEMAKVRKELDGVVGTSTMKESHLPQLPYLQACIKEAMRLYPASPMSIPRQTIEACEVMGYTIPKDCQILVNIYAIGTDPNSWTDPLTFQPERFLDSDVNYNGGHYQFIPFGSGRRVCVGLPLATRTIPLIVGSLVHTYDWGLPDGKRPEELEMKQKLRMSLAIDPTLCVAPKMRA